MKFPVLIRSGDRVLLFDDALINEIGSLNHGELQVAVDSEGNCKFHWILDCDGLFYGLSPKGFAPRTFAQLIGLQRRRATFHVASPRRLKVGQLMDEIAELKDHNPDFPNISHLKEALRQLNKDDIWTSDHMRTYLGE